MESVIHQNASAALEKFPRDLRAWLTGRQLAELASEAAELIAGRKPSPEENSQLTAAGPTRMLTVLTTCYLIGCWGSDDVEWATEKDSFIREIAQEPVDWREVRRFRQAHRLAIEQCLVHVLMTTIHRYQDRIPAATPADIPAVVYDAAVSWARRRIELAIMMDTAASD